VDRTIKILLIEDNPGDARLIEEMLKEANVRYELEGLDSLSSGIAKVKLDGYDIILLDLDLPDSHGLATLTKLNEIKPEAPIIVLTGLADEETGINAVKEGAQDYLVKGQVDKNLLTRSIRYGIERKAADRKIHESNERFRIVLNNAPITIFALDKQGVFTLSEGRGLERVGLKPGDNVGVSALGLYAELPVTLHNGESIRMLEVVRRVMAGETMTGITELRGIYFENQFTPYHDAQGKVNGLIGVATIITERMQAEAMLRHSEERFRSLVETTSDWVWEVDEKIRYTYVSPRIKNLLGYEPEEVLGKTPLDFMSPNEAKRVADIFGRIVAVKAPIVNMENTNLHKDGHKVILETSGVPFFDKNGKLRGYRGIDRDITERKKTEELMRSILESVDEGFIIVDREYRLLSANRAFAEKVGMPLQDIIGRHCHEISHRISRPCFEVGEQCAVKHVFETGEPRSVIHMHHDAKGNPVYTETKAYPLSKDDAGRIVTAIEILIDVTEKKKLEDQLRQSQKMEAIGQLAGGVAHDFNNILTAIIGYGHITLMKMAKDDPVRLNIEHMLEAADRAAHLTQSLLVFSRKQIMDKQPADLLDMIKRVQKFLVRILGEDIEVKSLLCEGRINCLADTGQMEQVIMNLATNARDAMPQGGMFTIAADRAKLDEEFIKAHGYGKPGEYAVMTVSDTGRGMDEKTRLRIFEPFFTTKEVGKGTGLGLSIVYGIIKQHDGYINVYSEPGIGTTFKIYLPLIAEEIKEKNKLVEAEYPEKGSEVILFAEDDESVRRMTKLILDESGYQVIEAVDGEDAVKKYMENKERIELLLFDLVMPKKSGKEAYDEIRKIMPDIRVVFISGYSPDIIQQKALIGQDMKLIFKPVSPTELLRKIRVHLNNK